MWHGHWKDASRCSVMVSSCQALNESVILPTCIDCAVTFGPCAQCYSTPTRLGIFVQKTTKQQRTLIWSICFYTVSRKKRPPKHVKITLWIENDSRYFSLYYEKPSICNVCVKGTVRLAAFTDEWMPSNGIGPSQRSPRHSCQCRECHWEIC